MAGLFPDPRVLGVKEHYERVQTFSKLACESEDPIVVFRLQVAGIHFARAIIELILDASDKKQLNTSREQLKKSLPKKIRWHALIERIRIHDFHRFGLIPPNPSIRRFFQGGPIKLHAKNGVAAYSIPPTGPQKEITGESSIEEQRPLINNDGCFYDDNTNSYVSMGQILKDFLIDSPTVIDDFEKSLKN